jgi:hypothetical protein
MYVIVIVSIRRDNIERDKEEVHINLGTANSKLMHWIVTFSNQRMAVNGRKQS